MGSDLEETFQNTDMKYFLSWISFQKEKISIEKFVIYLFEGAMRHNKSRKTICLISLHIAIISCIVRYLLWQKRRKVLI